MKKFALLFALAVFVPSLVLAWLALRSLRDQQLVIERQQALLYQSAADAIAKEIQGYLAERRREFGLQVEAMLAEANPREVAARFDEQLLKSWPWAEVGFVVSLDGNVFSPSLLSRPEARKFRLENDQFLCSREAVQVYWNSPKGAINLSQLDDKNAPSKFDAKSSGPQATEKDAGAAKEGPASSVDSQAPGGGPNQRPGSEFPSQGKTGFPLKGEKRAVVPQQQAYTPQPRDEEASSKVTASEAEFRQLIGDANEGTLARFLQNKLKVMFWYRSPNDPQLVFGAQLNLARTVGDLRELIQGSVFQMEPALRNNICVALLDETAKPAALSHPEFAAGHRRPFVSTEIGEMLPHWEAAVYLLNPEQINHSARAARLTIGFLIGFLLLAITIGGWLIVADLNRELTLARQKTDFVSNVSHELKTPLTSIRMFSEMLAEGRVRDESKQRTYLHVIAAEAARLTRLINNVLDFARMERGEKKYHLERCDVSSLVRDTVETYRPHLEAEGFHLNSDVAGIPLITKGDRDALAQIVVNLLSNAEKYSADRKEIAVQAKRRDGNTPMIEVRVMDRGSGVPKDCEEKIFEQFFRVEDSLNSGIQGSGLGLTLARQIARAHGGDVRYETREGGGSCFLLTVPLITNE
jgi:signal transduction histidine kinase